jgi:dTDP-4-amino-4,6-dideoxygalactose transaminase
MGRSQREDVGAARSSRSVELSQLHTAVARRQEIYDSYQEQLGTHVAWQFIRPHDRTTHKDLCLGLRGARGAVAEALDRACVETKRYFRPLHTMRPYARFTDGPLKVSEEVYEQSLCVPIFAELTTSDVEQVVDVILKALET